MIGFMSDKCGYELYVILRKLIIIIMAHVYAGLCV